jgi:hypothetical protein
MVLWRRPKDDPTVKTPAELQSSTDDIVAQIKHEAQRAKIVTTIIKQRVDLLEAAHRGT